MPPKPELRIGISGWRYEPWRGTFYPKGWVQKRELWYASRQLNSIEINGTFYSLQAPSSWKNWHTETPEDFVFSIKGNRFITHIRRLKEIEEPLANFFAQGILLLKEKLGPILWQFPPSFKFDADKLENFFAQLPRDMKEAARLAQQASERMKGRSFTEVEAENHPIRHAIEIRHDSFRNEQFIQILRKHNIGLVVAETAGKWPMLEDLTSDFLYIRLHGDELLYVSGYTEEALDKWARKIKAWQAGGESKDAVHASSIAGKKRKARDVYVYFDNDVKVRSPFDAIALSQRLNGYLPEQLPLDPPKTMPAKARTNWPITNDKSLKK